MKHILNIMAKIFSMSLNKQTWHISFCRIVRETRDKYIGGIQQQCHTGNPEVLHNTQEKEIVRKKVITRRCFKGTIQLDWSWCR
jgi:hypothetical protein